MALSLCFRWSGLAARLALLYSWVLLNLSDLSSLLKSLMQPSEITVKQLLWLALPSLAVGLLLRAALMVAIPEGYFGVDSYSYYEFSHSLFNGDGIDLNEKRRWIYPIFLALLDGLPGPLWSLVPVFQHLIGLFTVLGIGWCSAQVVARPRFVVPLVTMLAAVWPRMLWYEHEFIAESLLLAAFVAVIALLLTPDIVRSRCGLIALMMAFVLLAGMKGAGRFLWMGSVLSLFLIHRHPWRWRWGGISSSLAVFSIFLVSTIGKSSQGDWLALSSSLPLVRTEGEPYSFYREALKGQILEAREYGDDYPWVVKYYKKRLNSKSPDLVHPAWAELNQDDFLFSKVAREFWSDGVLHNPLQFSLMTGKTMTIALSGSTLNTRLNPESFWKAQAKRSAKIWRNDPQYFQRLFGVNKAEFELRSAKGAQRQFVFLPAMRWVDRYFSWWGRGPGSSGGGVSGSFPVFEPKPLGLMASLGGVAGLVFPTKRLQCLALFLPFILYMFGTFAVGDAVRRYLQPVEWVGFVFVGVFFDRLIHLLFNMISVFRSQRAVS